MALSKEEKRIARIWQFYDKHRRFPFEVMKEDPEIEESKEDFDSLFSRLDGIPES